MYDSRLDLNAHLRKAICRLLQDRLSEALDLEAQAKQAHWNVKGPDFLQLHAFFDTVHGQAELFADTLAERIAALGGIADGRIQTTVQASNLHEYSLETRSGSEHLRALAAALAQFGKATRADIGPATAEGDAVSVDILTGIARESDKLLWLIEAHLV
jgi:starvation-inducible DNA-binding protein